ncbi:MAG: hypothetical protein COA79_19305 [Planctomycetota bacterium]|nr:MAG: hypothetical protein COA79_19305 [Planctomycetota bacterium]
MKKSYKFYISIAFILFPFFITVIHYYLTSKELPWPYDGTNANEPWFLSSKSDFLLFSNLFIPTTMIFGQCILLFMLKKLNSRPDKVILLICLASFIGYAAFFVLGLFFYLYFLFGIIIFIASFIPIKDRNISIRLASLAWCLVSPIGIIIYFSEWFGTFGD